MIIACIVAIIFYVLAIIAGMEALKETTEYLDTPQDADYIQTEMEPEPAIRPAKTLSLLYTGPAFPPTWNNYDTPKMTGGGAKNVGLYNANFEVAYISPRLERVMRRYAEQLRRVKKWEHYAAHAKKARTRKKYRNRLREYYSREPAFRPAGLYSGHGINSTSGVWWLRAPCPGAAAYCTPPSKMGGFFI